MGCSDCGGLVLHMCQEGLPGMSMPERYVAGKSQVVYIETITAPMTKLLQAKPQQAF